MRYIIIFILVIVVSFLLLKQYLLKQQLKNIAKQMEEQRECSVSIDLVDKDLEMVTIQINHMIDFVQTVRAEALREEQNLRTSISMISHDMRTPLTSVIGYLQLAKKNCKEKETLQDIEIALDRANYLSFDSRGIAPTFEQADDTIWVWADKKLLTRVIQNLISNSIKYSTGEVGFSVFQGQKVVVNFSSSVSKKVEVEKIFDKFYKADNSRSNEGSGLGLYICRKFIEDMNGTISAQSNNEVFHIKIELDLYLM